MAHIHSQITLANLTRIMSIVHHVAFGVKTPRSDSGYSLEKKFTKLISMNP